MRWPRSRPNSLCRRRIRRGPATVTTAPAGGGVVVRVLGNERARDCGAGIPRRRHPATRPARSASSTDRCCSRCRPPRPTDCGKPRAGWPTGSTHTRSDLAPSDLAYTLARRRAHRPVRTAVIAGSLEELTERSARGRRRRLLRISPRSGRTTGDRYGCSPGRVRSGRAMGAELLATEPVFAATVAEARAADRPRVRLLCD